MKIVRNKKINFVVVSYYTISTIYEREIRRLLSSVQLFGLPYCIKSYSSFANWYEGIQFKPVFLLKMLDKFPKTNLVYVDADSKFLRFPTLFSQLMDEKDVNIGIHQQDSSKELLTNTLFLKNNKIVRDILTRWVDSCSRCGSVWDTVSLKRALGKVSYYPLPEEYCVLDKNESKVNEPVICHYQISQIQHIRENRPSYKRKKKNIKKPLNLGASKISGLRKVRQGGIWCNPKKNRF